ncbi:MAG: S41 family peptidase [Bacteroidota bacterium]
MNQLIILVVITCVMTQVSFAQKTLETPLSREDMKTDLEWCRKIRDAANSGVYKYRTPAEIDSIYHWATQEIEQFNTVGDFYNIINTITDFEGSLHNTTQLPRKISKNLRSEINGYFPYPIKLIEDEVRINIEGKSLPLGSKIQTINGKKIEKVLTNFYKYYATDGFNLTGKTIGINENFSLYYRFHYGKKEEFEITYQLINQDEVRTASIKSVGYKEYYQNFDQRYSKKIDFYTYAGSKDFKKTKDLYHFQIIDHQIAQLTINTFLIGWHAKDPKHLEYTQFLDSIFTILQEQQILNLIVDVRHNGGGSDPNDLVTYSYLTDRNFMENKEAWIAFQKIPYYRHIRKEVFFLFKPIEKILSNQGIPDAFPDDRNGRYYQDAKSPDHLVRTPKPNAFKGKIYLLVSPTTASAGSLFAAMVAGNENTIVIGEETQGGYYGHNGHIPIRYWLPKSKIRMMFSIVNLEQDVPEKASQPFGSGVMPDYEVEQSLEGFLNQKDTVLDYTLNLIRKNKQVGEKGTNTQK